MAFVKNVSIFTEVNNLQNINEICDERIDDYLYRLLRH